MGKDRRKKDVNRKQATYVNSDNAGSEPKAQREPRNRAYQDRREKEDTKNVENSIKDKTVENLPPPQPLPKEEVDTKELFANLKRETDDIKALSTKKTPSRQIFSSWTSYNKQLPDPEQEVEMQGADFIDLVKAPISVGGHFQFKSEKTWDASVSALSGEFFSLNIDLLSAGLATVPFYEKLGLPISLFSPAEIEDMNYHAKQSKTRYESTKKNTAGHFNKKQSIMRIEEILSMKETSPEASEQISADKNSGVLSFDIEGPQIQEEISEADVSEKNSATVTPVKEVPVISSHDHHKPTTVGTKSSADLPKKEVTPVKEIPAIVSRSDQYKPNIIGAKCPADLPKEDCTTTSVKEVPDVKRRNHNKTTMSKKSAGNKILAKQTLEVDSNLIPPAHKFKGDEATCSIKSKAEHMKISAENFETESNTAPEVSITSKTEAISISEDVKEAPEDEESEWQKLQEVTAPLGQRSSRRKPKDQAAAVRHEKVEKKKSRNVDDDLDFLLGLKKPVRTIPTPISQPVQVTKPTIEDDDANANAQISLIGAQKPTEDLEDWLDSMLDD